MRKKWALLSLGLCLLSSGCGPITLAARTLVLEPIHDWAVADAVLEHHRDYHLAEESWDAIAQADPEHTYSPDFIHGFKDGFADYVYAGGSGEPPLPPRYYWKVRYETPQGHQAIADWFAGFRLGAELARESGYREWVVIPSALLRTEGADLHLSPSVPVHLGPPASVPVLPPPRKVTPAQDPSSDGNVPPPP
jgi:hypothetical protein